MHILPSPPGPNFTLSAEAQYCQINLKLKLLCGKLCRLLDPFSQMNEIKFLPSGFNHALGGRGRLGVDESARAPFELLAIYKNGMLDAGC